MPNDISVLFVDDEPEIRNLLTEYIGDVLGYSVHSCCNGRDALDYLAGLPVMPKLIITDIAMPEVNGLVFAQRLNDTERYREIPVVLASSHADGTLEVTSNVTKRILKPYYLLDIKNLIESYLGPKPIDETNEVLP
jgi:CheY-like chemotaxis protein